MTESEEYFLRRHWSVRVINRGSDYDVANVVRGNPPDGEILARAIWPDYAKRLVDEHNEDLARCLFQQNSGATEQLPRLGR